MTHSGLCSALGGKQTNTYRDTHMLVYNVYMSHQWNKTTPNSNLNYKKSQNESLCTYIKGLWESESKNRLTQEPVKCQYVKIPLQPGQEIPQVTKTYFKGSRNPQTS